MLRFVIGTSAMTLLLQSLGKPWNGQAMSRLVQQMYHAGTVGLFESGCCSGAKG